MSIELLRMYATHLLSGLVLIPAFMVSIWAHSETMSKEMMSWQGDLLGWLSVAAGFVGVCAVVLYGWSGGLIFQTLNTALKDYDPSLRIGIEAFSVLLSLFALAALPVLTIKVRED